MKESKQKSSRDSSTLRTLKFGLLWVNSCEFRVLRVSLWFQICFLRIVLGQNYLATENELPKKTKKIQIWHLGARILHFSLQIRILRKISDSEPDSQVWNRRSRSQYAAIYLLHASCLMFMIYYITNLILVHIQSRCPIKYLSVRRVTWHLIFRKQLRFESHRIDPRFGFSHRIRF